GVAMGVGLCASSHLEGTLAKLDEYGKSDAFKKSPSIFNLLKHIESWLGSVHDHERERAITATSNLLAYYLQNLNVKVRVAVGQTVLILASQHLQTVINALVNQPLPYDRVAAEALRILLARAQLDEVMKRLDEDNAWDALKEQNTHITGVTLLARRVNEQHDGEDIRSLLHGSHAGCARTGQHSKQITTMFQNHLHEDKSLHYGEFINDLTKYLDFPGMLNFYHISVIQFFKSNWPEVRAAAAMFIGTAALGNITFTLIISS
ncbi:hypothetical protein XENOCAPTIV_026953, partial [Xenoophorus captivus]